MKKEKQYNKDELEGIEMVYSKYFMEESHLEVF